VFMKKIASVAALGASALASAPAFAQTVTPSATTMLEGVDFADAIAGVFAAGGLIAGLIVAGTGVRWALRFLRG